MSPELQQNNTGKIPSVKVPSSAPVNLEYHLLNTSRIVVSLWHLFNNKSNNNNNNNNNNERISRAPFHVKHAQLR